MTQIIKPIFVDEFYCEGRGPELHKVHWAFSGHTLRAIDFMNPDESESRHLFFTGVQVVMITPEEVINYETVDQRWIDFRPAGILDLGKSLWLESFSPQHLEKCFHYQIMFYDELFDVICEGIEVREGSYSGD